MSSTCKNHRTIAFCKRRGIGFSSGRTKKMLKKLSLGPIVALVIAVGAVVLVRDGLRTAQAFAAPQTETTGDQAMMMPATENGFSVEVLVDGRLVPEYAARGRPYAEALQNAEKGLRIHNTTLSGG